MSPLVQRALFTPQPPALGAPTPRPPVLWGGTPPPPQLLPLGGGPSLAAAVPGLQAVEQQLHELQRALALPPTGLAGQKRQRESSSSEDPPPLQAAQQLQQQPQQPAELSAGHAAADAAANPLLLEETGEQVAATADDAGSQLLG